MKNQIDELASIFYCKNTSDYIKDCAIEEMSELIKVIIKSNRGMTNIDNFKEEIGHVLLMCHSLMQLYDINDKDVLIEANDAVYRMLHSRVEK